MAEHKLPAEAAAKKKQIQKTQADVELVTPAYRAAERELQAADTIINMVMEAAQGEQFHLHVTKIRETSAEGISEELTEKRLGALDTKRILEAARALEKVVTIKRKLLDMEETVQQPENAQLRIVLPEVIAPPPPGAAG